MKRHGGFPSKWLLAALCASLASPLQLAADQSGPATRTSHGLTLFGELKYGPGFTHFEYANPEAPKGGAFVYGFASTFDNLNPFIVAGSAPGQNLEVLVHDPLMQRSGDEPASLYGVLAESVTWPEDHAWVEFTLRESARWHDGRPVTPKDVMFSVETLKTRGTPQYRASLGNVVRTEQKGPRSVRFFLAEGSDRNTLYTVAQLVVLPEHWWRERDFSSPSVEPPLGSGPYRVEKVDPGRSITYERVADYWGRDLPANRGLWNFDRIRHDYYRDITIEQEALLAGKVDLRWETLPGQWATGYDVDAARDGRLIREMLPYEGTTMYAGYFFNLRKPVFRDARVREAIAHAFDFEWTNRNILHGQYTRLKSHFQNSELAATGPPSAAELELLEPWRDRLPAGLFAGAFEPPRTDGTRQSLRDNLRAANALLQAAGYALKDGRMLSASGEPLEFEIIAWDPFFERVTGPFVKNLELLGITARQRTIDTAQWFQRMQSFNFDLSNAFYFPQSMSPGTELRQFWGSAMANQPGGSNFAGIADPVVDALVEKVIVAPDRRTKVAATRALDRVLMWNWYSIPHYYSPGIPIVYWDKFGRPDKDPTWLRVIWHMSNWWVDPRKAAALESRGRSANG